MYRSAKSPEALAEVGDEVRKMTDEQLEELTRQAAYGRHLLDGPPAASAETFQAKVDRAMGWRKYAIDVMGYALIVCACTSFAASVFAWLSMRGLWDVVGWMAVAAVQGALAFLSYCIAESSVESALKREEPKEES